jgi:DNA polymerase elongation subunit (family B)
MDPSVMTGHNILSYDLPYLENCAKGNSLLLGRDGSAIVFAEKSSKFRKDGSQQYEYNNARITGREIIDTFFLSIKYDIGRDFPSYGLKPIIKHLKLEKEGRTFIDASKIGSYYKNRTTDTEMWGKVKAYATEDSDDALKLYDIMIPAFFYLAQSIPKTFQQMINEASGSQLDSLMIRSYLQDGNSQPMTSKKAAFEGAISMGVPGVYGNVAKADVASLYPSIMLEYNIHDSKKDPNNHMIAMLTYFRDERLKNKKLAKETGEKYYDDMQNAQKIMINSMYGFLGSRFLLYNYPEGGAAVTRHGREILLKSVAWATGHTLEKTVKEIVHEGTEDEEIKYEWSIGPKVSEGRGYSLVNVDTDSFSVTNGAPISRDMFASELKSLNALYSPLIRWEDDGIYEKVIVIRAKNYVLVKDGKVKYKGSAMTDQKKEPALAEMLENMVKAMLANETSMLPSIYKNYVSEAMNIQDISRWLTKKTVTKAVLYGSETASRNVMSAIQESIDRGIIEGVQEGDKVWLYDAIDGVRQDTKKGEPVFYKDGTPKMIPNYILRDYRLWKNDEDKMHYVKRVFDTVQILENLIDKKDFLNYTLKTNQPLLKELDK